MMRSHTALRVRHSAAEKKRAWRGTDRRRSITCRVVSFQDSVQRLDSTS
jgi:hypothetical protein